MTYYSYCYTITGINNETNFIWDEPKRQSNIERHGIDFEIAGLVLSDPNVKTRKDDRIDYGEDRFLSFGLVGELRLCLCWTPRGGKIRVISLFRINKKDWEAEYEKHD
ncbi:MAG: BrnT family toxin [Rickettsiales bacterium]|nr:BrnT family toxin [Rickettsiales bacterium]